MAANTNYGKKIIYATGVYLRPVKILDTWQWVAGEFVDDSYDDDGDYYEPLLLADTLEELEKGRVCED